MEKDRSNFIETMNFINDEYIYLPFYAIRDTLSLSLTHTHYPSTVQFISIEFAIIYNAFVKHGIPADERPSIYHAAHRTIKRVTVVTTQANIRLSLVSIFHSLERKAFR